MISDYIIIPQLTFGQNFQKIVPCVTSSTSRGMITFFHAEILAMIYSYAYERLASVSADIFIPKRLI